MADTVDARAEIILGAMVRELMEQGQGGAPTTTAARLTAYPIKGTIDVVALSEAIEVALGGDDTGDSGRMPAELNANNDG